MIIAFFTGALVGGVAATVITIVLVASTRYTELYEAIHEEEDNG